MKGQQQRHANASAESAVQTADPTEEAPLDYDALEAIMGELTSSDPDPEVCAELFDRLGPRGQDMVMADGTMGPKARELGLGGAGDDEGGWLWGLVDAGAKKVGVDADAVWDTAEGAADQMKGAGSGLIGSDWNPMNHPAIRQMEDAAGKLSESANAAWDDLKKRTGLNRAEDRGVDASGPQRVEEQQQQEVPGPALDAGVQVVTRPGQWMTDAAGKTVTIKEAVLVQVIETTTTEATVTTGSKEEAGKKDSYHIRSVDPDGPAIDHWAGFGALCSAAELSAEMGGETLIPLDKCRGNEKKVAQIWNEKGGYIDRARGSIERAVAVAVMCAESGGAGTGASGEPIIRFENHKLKRNNEALTVDWGTKDPETYANHFKFVKSAQGHEVNHQGADKGGTWEAFHGSQGAEWKVFALAERLAGREVAARCISIGAGQVMGFNAAKLGYASATEMLDEMTSDIEANVGGVFAFIEANPTAKAALAKGDFVGFAAEYNGNDYKDSYGTIIESYTVAFRAVEAKYLGAADAAADT